MHTEFLYQVQLFIQEINTIPSEDGLPTHLQSQ